MFKDFGLDEKILEGLDAMGFTKPTPIQEQAIPLILEGKDIIACAQTGTGKTAAYLLPLLHKIEQSAHRHLNTIIIAPTRELALQIDQQVQGFSYFLSTSSIPVYGGGSGSEWDQQKRALKEGADIIIATPGRLIAQLTSGALNLEHVEHLVLDEADRMLDMGFLDDILRIISYLPKNRQTLLFSATMPARIRTLAAKILKEPAEINIAISKPAEGIVQVACMTYDQQKLPLLKALLSEKSYSSVIIFCSTKDNVKNLEREMSRAGLSCKGFHSDLEQTEREDILRQFRNRQLQTLIGTDILSRGIDVEGIELVINYDVPPDPEDYIHRIGRTARAETTGKAITFINEKDQLKFSRIERMLEKEIPKFPLPPELGEAPIYAPAARKNNNNRKPSNKKKFKPGKKE